MNFRDFRKILLKSLKICYFSPRFPRIFAGISQNVRNFDGLDVANFKIPEFFEKIPKFCRNILQKFSLTVSWLHPIRKRSFTYGPQRRDLLLGPGPQGRRGGPRLPDVEGEGVEAAAPRALDGDADEHLHARADHRRVRHAEERLRADFSQFQNTNTRQCLIAVNIRLFVLGVWR